MTITASQFTGANSQTVLSGNMPGLGFQAVVTVVHTDTYTPIGGQAVDLSAIFPTEVIGGCVIADTQDDGGYKSAYVLATAGAPATGLIQMYLTDSNNVADSAFSEVADMTALTAIDGQTWLFVGR